MKNRGHQNGLPETARGRLPRRPRRPSGCSRGGSAHQAGRLPDAEADYRQVLASRSGQRASAPSARRAGESGR